jgi:hypothetical protein
LNPCPSDDKSRDPALGPLSTDKQFHGVLEAAGQGHMLTDATPVEGSDGYVVIERVSGTLHGRGAAFAFQHTGLLTRGDPQLTITVLPNSGNGQLLGLPATTTITDSIVFPRQFLPKGNNLHTKGTIYCYK